MGTALYRNWPDHSQLPKLSRIPKRYVTKHETYDWEMWLHDTTQTNQIPANSQPYPKPDTPRIANYGLYKKYEKLHNKNSGCQKSFNVFKGQKVKESKQITMEFLNCNLSEERLLCPVE